jgi:hypothetical protein
VFSSDVSLDGGIAHQVARQGDLRRGGFDNSPFHKSRPPETGRLGWLVDGGNALGLALSCGSDQLPLIRQNGGSNGAVTIIA